MSVFNTFAYGSITKWNVIIKKISLKYDIMDSFSVTEKLKKKPIDRNYYINRLREMEMETWIEF